MTSTPEPTDHTEVTRLRRSLAAVRLSYADLLAAARATVAADRDGDPNPLEYLRDELTQHPALPSESPVERPDRGSR